MKYSTKKLEMAAATLVRKEKSRGSSMVEVLVALVVLSVGLLGLAMLQVKSMKINTEAFQNTQATLLASDLMEKIRTNRNGNYAINSKPSSRPSCTDNCTSNELAIQEVWDWHENMIAFLGPTASGGITKTSTTQYSIVISWSEQNRDTKKLIPTNRTWVIEI